MKYPIFFDSVPAIELTDPLAEVLGTFENGEMSISYLDVVKGSGHSCPTVAGAYLMTYHALQALFPDQTAIRGKIAVNIAENIDEGTTGVTATVITYITGAAAEGGFKGIHGNFVRHSLMAFGQEVPSVRFTRLDNQKSVDVFYDPSTVSVDPKQMELMQLILEDKASAWHKEEFANIWQERVKRILIDNFDNPSILRINKL